MNTIRDSRPITIGKSYEVNDVESAEKLPNGDIVLSAKGHDFIAAGESAAGEPQITKSPSSFALLLLAGEIQAAKMKKERRQSVNHTSITAIRREMRAVEGGTPFVVLQSLDNEEAIRITGRNAAAIHVHGGDRMSDGNGGFYRPSLFITYIEQEDDGTVFWISIVPDAKDIQKSRRKKLWLLPVAVVGDVVTSPIQIIYQLMRP